MSASLLSLVLDHAVQSPHREFLVEDKGVYLSYSQSYVLATKLISQRLRTLYPPLTTSVDPKVVILTRNNTLFPLSLLALWAISATAIPFSTGADPSLWVGMIDLIEPDVVLVEADLVGPLLKLLDETSLKGTPKIIEIGSLIPPEFTSSPRQSVRASDFIPSCHRWLDQVCLVADKSLQSILNDIPIPSLKTEMKAVTLFTSSAVDRATLKCVSYTHEMLFHSAARAMLMLGGPSYSSTPKRHLGWLPLSHCFELCITFCGVILCTGGAYIFFDRSVSSPAVPASTSLPILLLEGLSYHSPVTAFAAMPAVFAELIPLCTQADLERLQALESLGVGGARTSEALFQWAASQNIAYFDCSGATEAAGTICIRRALDMDQRQNGLQVISGLMGALEKAQLSDNFGELVIRGTFLPTGYDYRESDAFHFDLETGITTYRTGDLYSHRENVPELSYLAGEDIPSYNEHRPALTGLSYIGRTDDMVVFNSGVKIDALSLEGILDASPEIARSALLGNKNGDALVALIQPRASSQPEWKSLLNTVLELNVSLPFEKRLRRENIFIVHDLPVTTKFTLNRKKLKKLFSEMSDDSDIPRLFPSLIAVASDADAAFNSSHPPHHVLSSEKPLTSVDLELRRRVSQLLARIFSIHESHFDYADANLSEIPLTSLTSVRLAKALRDEFSVQITSAQLYGIHNMGDLYSILATGAYIQSIAPSVSLPTPLTSTSEVASKPCYVNKSQDIVVAGAACRFVGGIDSLDSFWSALLSPDIFVKQLSRKRPDSRWQSDHPDEDMMFPSGWLDDSAIENISSVAGFFKLSPNEARTMSPNARLVLQLGYQAIEDAGIAPLSLNGQNWGVFTSVNDSGWRERKARDLKLKDYAMGMHGSADDAVGARLSYFLDLTGPAVEIKTACSSSAVAIHQACSAIQNGDCEAAVVIAATTHFHPAGAIFRSQNGIVSATGRCIPFSDFADGFVASEGAAAIVLQKRENVKGIPYGLIRASAVGQDGSSRGFFAPNPKAQARLLEKALEKAVCVPDDLSLLEAHGTGTQLGDSIELQAIQDVFAAKRTPLYIGSVKAVIGHTEECAGLSGVLKVLMCLTNNAIPPQPRSGPLNEAIDRSSTVIAGRITAFAQQDTPRICSVSSFGLYGTLANIIIEECQVPPSLSTPNNSQIFILSARNTLEFRLSVKRHIEFFRCQHLRPNELADVCRTAQIGRDHFSVRRAWCISGWKTLLDALKKALLEDPPRTLPLRHTPRIGIWFGLPLTHQSITINQHDIYRSILADCSRTGWASQYKFFEQQLVLAQCLIALGCNISIVGGEGIAEYVAAVFAGLLPSAAVFRLSGPASEGTSIVVARCSESALKQSLASWRQDELHIVGVHGPRLFTLRGTSDALAALSSEPDVTVDTQTSTPSPTILSPASLLHLPKIAIVSGHLGKVLDEDTVMNFHYWNSIQERVTYKPAASAAMSSHCDIVVDLGMVNEVANSSIFGKPWLTDHGNSLERIVRGLFEEGCAINWKTFTSPGQRAHLPGYSWAMDALSGAVEELYTIARDD